MKNGPIASHSDSDSVYELAADWLKYCRSHHPDCPPVMASPLPTRLLDVSGVTTGGTSQNPFLYISDANERSQYVALSYCWGEQGNDDFVLTQSTLERKMETIPLSSLPQTLRDAITITKWLGFRYLWIDALCILQDSKEDWEKEAAVMGKVYSNAVVTIAASAASESSQGFLLPREDFNATDPQLVFCGPDGTMGLVSVRYEFPSATDIGQPLDLRGWALQERLLSPRLLSYETRRLRWTCQTDTYLEGKESTKSMRSRDPMFPTSLIHFSEAPSSISSAAVASRPYDYETDTFYQWAEIVEGYASRELRYQTDKLPALSGIASQVQQTLGGDEYLAGLWKSHMPRALAWIVVGKSKLGKRGRALPRGWHCPSWSWASITGAIRCLYDYDDVKKKIPSLLKFLNHRITLSGLNMFGSVSAGMVQVRGRLKRAGCVIITNHTSEYHRYGTKSSLYIDERYAGCLPPVRPPTEHRLGTCSFDDYDEMLQSLADGPIWCLQMERTHGLLLVPVVHVLSGDSGHDQIQYRRVGHYKISHEEPEKNSWFDDCGEEDIWIV